MNDQMSEVSCQLKKQVKFLDKIPEVEMEVFRMVS